VCLLYSAAAVAGGASSGVAAEQGRATHARSRVGRLSSKGQRERRAALEAQRRKIAAACRRRGWQLLETVGDAGRSAQDRGSEQAQRVLERADAQALVAAKRDRPARTLLDLANLLASAHKHGWALVDLKTTPSGEETMNLRATFAPSEWQLLSQRSRAALARARAQGVRLGRPPTMPAHVIERIKREREAGNSLAAIANRLNADRIPTAQGGQRWYPATIQYTLSRTR
jgi:DNA invertase Pin-like site-specific DNA recombinase